MVCEKSYTSARKLPKTRAFAAWSGMNDPPTLELVHRVLLERKHDGVRKHERALGAASRQLWRLFVKRRAGERAALMRAHRCVGKWNSRSRPRAQSQPGVRRRRRHGRRALRAAVLGAALWRDDVEQRVGGVSSAAVVAAVRDAWRAYQRACNGASALLSPLAHVYLRTCEDARLERDRRGEYSVFFVGEYRPFMAARVDVGAVLPFRDLLRRFFYRAVLRPLGARLTASLSACLDAGESEWSEQRLCRLLAPAAGEGDAERGALDRVVRAYREWHRVAEIACALAPFGLPVLLLLRLHEWQCAAELDQLAGERVRRWRAAAVVHRAC